MRIKICGLKAPETIKASVDAGADFLGFNFFKKSPRYISPEDSAELAKLVPSPIKKVAVVVDPDNELLQAIYENLRPDFIQLHGNESPTRAVAIRETFQTPIIKAIPVSEPKDLKQAELYKDIAMYLLFDAKPPKDAVMPGGLGKTFDWNILTTNHKPQTTPFFLSGGLTPQNVAEAIHITQPYGVDVSSGVESSPGVKDSAKIIEFIQNAKQAKI